MKNIVFLALCLLITGCQPPPPVQDSSLQTISIKEPLNRVNIVDHSGLSETITSPERLKEFAQRNFLDPQPYQKVARVYTRDKEGTAHSIITSYYENGQIRQYLECTNGRACGLYQEWHGNGQKKLLTRVLAGQADIDDKAFGTWSFEGTCTAWDDQGAMSAVFTYQHGALNGPSTTFYPTGEKETATPYEEGYKEGAQTTFDRSGGIVRETTFHRGMRHGPAFGRHPNGSNSWSEEYVDDHLIRATYLSPSGEELSSVTGGEGLRSVFDEDLLVSQEEVHGGIPEGWTTHFDTTGCIELKYQVRNGKKHGTEIRYFPGTSNTKLSIEWRDGIIHGTVKTWYANGTLESQREMSQNLKQGMATAWYPNGSLMLVEEYAEDKLIRGQYHQKGDSVPTSTIEHGNGMATLFDPSGTIIEKVTYCDGKPQVGD